MTQVDGLSHRHITCVRGVVMFLHTTVSSDFSVSEKKKKAYIPTNVSSVCLFIIFMHTIKLEVELWNEHAVMLKKMCRLYEQIMTLLLLFDCLCCAISGAVEKKGANQNYK